MGPCAYVLIITCAPAILAKRVLFLVALVRVFVRIFLHVCSVHKTADQKSV